MEKLTQKQIILKFLEWHNDWIKVLKIPGRETKWGFIGSEGDRRTRELFAEGKVEKKREGRFEYYRAIGVKEDEDWNRFIERFVKKTVEDVLEVHAGKVIDQSNQDTLL